MKTIITQRGFTLVELVIGIAAASLLALTVGMMLAAAYRGWVRSLAVADLERDMSVAVHTLDMAVRGAEDAVDFGVNKLQVRMPSNGVVRAFSAEWSGSPARGSLYYYPDYASGVRWPVVDKRLVSFITSTAGVIRVTMTLTAIDDNNQETLVTMGVTNMSIYMRN